MGYRMMCNQENLREEPREAPVAPGLVDLDVSTTREEQRMAARNRFAQRSAPEKRTTWAYHHRVGSASIANKLGRNIQTVLRKAGRFPNVKEAGNIATRDSEGWKSFGPPRRATTRRLPRRDSISNLRLCRHPRFPELRHRPRPAATL